MHVVPRQTAKNTPFIGPSPNPMTWANMQADDNGGEKVYDGIQGRMITAARRCTTVRVLRLHRMYQIPWTHFVRLCAISPVCVCGTVFVLCGSAAECVVCVI